MDIKTILRANPEIMSNVKPHYLNPSLDEVVMGMLLHLIEHSKRLDALDGKGVDGDIGRRNDEVENVAIR